jgi:sugar O-acyltransferase (sialic acid O-acetyltransferase NeuD family)
LKTLAILGASGHGKVVADLASCLDWTTIQFFDDAWPEKSKIGDWDVIGNTAKLEETINSYHGVVIAIGQNKIRLEKQSRLEQAGGEFVHLIHPSAVVRKRSSVGPGSVIMAGAIVNAFTVIGRACIVNTAATVDHDVLIEDGSHISPGANLAGAVQVGQCSWVGIGSSVLQNIKIGARATVGAGAVVIRDVLDYSVVTGCPAIPLLEKEN